MELLLVDEFARVVRDSLGDSAVPLDDDGKVLCDVTSFLIVNQLAAEAMAASQLAVQDIRSAWKSKAIAALVDDLALHVPLAAGEAVEAEVAPLPAMATASLKALAEPLNFAVPDEAPEAGGGVDQRLRRVAADLADALGPSGLDGAQRAIEWNTQLLTEVRLGGGGRQGARLLRSSCSSESVDGEVVRESEQEQEKQAEVEMIAVARVGRDPPRGATTWNMSVLRQGDTEGWLALTDALVSKMDVSALSKLRGLREALGDDRALAPHEEVADGPPPRVRFSPNAEPQKQSSPGLGIFKPILLVLHVFSGRTSHACALSLAEAAAVRRAIEQGVFSACGLQLALRLRAPLGAGGGRTLAREGAKATTEQKGIIAKQQALLRFCSGDVWLSEGEVEFLGRLAQPQRGAWLSAWKACEAWRRSGGILRWDMTPLGKVLGDTDCVVELLKEESIQRAAVALAALAGGVESAVDLHAWLQRRFREATAPRNEVLRCFEDMAGWALLVEQVCNERGHVVLQALAEEAASRLGGGHCCPPVLQSTCTRQLLGSVDFISAARGLLQTGDG